MTATKDPHRRSRVNAVPATKGDTPVRPASDAAVPPGTLSKPFFGKQGDEQREPTPGEVEELGRIQRGTSSGRRGGQ